MLKKSHKELVIALEKWFVAKKKVAVAFSGGVDSSLLFFLGNQALGRNCKGLFAKSPLMSRHQVDDALGFARTYNLEFEERLFSPLDLPGFSENSAERCYICKKGLYENFKSSLAPGWHLADGTNLDDDPGQRPGSKAIQELGIATPFLTCSIGKKEIRSLSRALGLATWDKPSDSCLATRIARQEPISVQGLQMIEDAEAGLRYLGFAGGRVQLQDDKLLLTFKEGDLERALMPQMRRKIQKKLADRGFLKVFLDLSERQGILP